MQRVMPAHDALELRELADHAGDQIGLGQQPCPGRELGRGLGHALRDPARQLLEARRLGAERAEARVEHDPIELRDPAGERPLAVLVPEELRVPQARAQHALVACDHSPTIVLGREIGDRDEARRQASFGVLERQVLLMMAHRRDQDFLRQRHEALVDPAKQGDRPLDQAGELGEQRRILAQAQILLARKPGRLDCDRALPLGAVQLDVGGRQLLAIVLEVAHFDRRGREKPVTVGGGAGAQRPELDRHHLAVEQTEDAAQRTYPADLVVAPAHRLGPRKARQERADPRCQDTSGVDPPGRSERATKQLLALPVVPLLERIVAHAERRREAVEGRLRRPTRGPRPFHDSYRACLAGRPCTRSVSRLGVSK